MRALLGCILVLVAAALTSPPSPARAQGFPLQLTLVLDRGAYQPGDSISFTVAARNVTREPVTLSFPSTQRIEVLIRKESLVVSRYSDSQPVSPGLGTQRWAAGETLTFTGMWTPYTLVGPAGFPGVAPQFLAPAMYSISAELTSAGFRIPSPPQPLVIGRPTPIGPGCTSVTTFFGMTMPAETVAAIVVPISALRGMWRLDATLGRYVGYLPDATAPRDLMTVPAGGDVLLCTSSAAMVLLPDP